MKVRFAGKEDFDLLSHHDKHVDKEELSSIIKLKRVLIAEDEGAFVGWLRWGLFWDNTPFMNMLYFLEGQRGKGYGKKLVTHWEKLMKQKGYSLVMTSTMSNESAQHFYRKLQYVDSGSLLLKNEPLEIIFTKEI